MASHVKALEQLKCGHAIFNRPGCKQTVPFSFIPNDNIVLWLKYALFQKMLQIKVFRHRISDRKVRKGTCLSPPRVELGGSKDDMIEILNCTETEKYIHFFRPYHLSSLQNNAYF